MSRELREKRFLPERGDKISIAGNFNDWHKDSKLLTNSSTFGVYEAGFRGSSNSDSFVAHGDTLVFKFVLTPGDGREVANLGWETVGNHVLQVSDLRNGRALLVFNGPTDGKETFKVDFSARVPEDNLAVKNAIAGSQAEVIVTGDFCGWREDGIPLYDQEEPGVYGGSVPIRWIRGHDIEYQFKLLVIPSRGAVSGVRVDELATTVYLRLRLETTHVEAPRASLSSR